MIYLSLRSRAILRHVCWKPVTIQCRAAIEQSVDLGSRCQESSLWMPSVLWSWHQTPRDATSVQLPLKLRPSGLRYEPSAMIVVAAGKEADGETSVTVVGSWRRRWATYCRWDAFWRWYQRRPIFTHQGQCTSFSVRLTDFHSSRSVNLNLNISWFEFQDSLENDAAYGRYNVARNLNTIDFLSFPF